MTSFEIFVLAVYMTFAFVYMINTYGVDKADSIWFRIFLILFALTFGIVSFPIVFGIDIYNKLHK